jgi:hypothetical protein
MIKITIEIHNDQQGEKIDTRLRVYGDDEKECQVADIVVESIEDVLMKYGAFVTTMRDYKVQ